ncbi:MAG: maleylpyruvate isomerase family mycothiol-dependent enzyme [Propionicimonas sp.]
MQQLGGSIPVEEIQLLAREADQGLLRDTIGILEQDWQGPSLLPGWTRAHVATHLARSADGMRILTEASLSGEAPGLPGPDERFSALERGAERSGLELQIDLDTSASALTATRNTVTDWHRPIRFLGRTRPLSTLPVARLHEVFIHHVDLDCGFTPDQVPPEAAGWLLSWVFGWVHDLDVPAVAVHSESGLDATVGRGPVEDEVNAEDGPLWAWLSGRAPLVTGDATRAPFPLLV